MPATSRTLVYAIIGDPIEHSLSPLMHNAAFKELDLNSVYVPFRVQARFLRESVRGLRHLGVAGFNVTVPHKTEIIHYLQRIDSLAKRIGAVNTVSNMDVGLVGYNTDAVGALDALKQNDVPIDASSFLILGAGGAARAVVYALLEVARRIVVLNRTVEKARALGREIRKKTSKEIEINSLTRGNLAKAVAAADVLVNATSVGMAAQTLPIETKDLRKELTVFDMVYGQSETVLQRQARESGCRTISGIEMLLCQGARAFEIWTGLKPPLDVMREALANAMVR